MDHLQLAEAAEGLGISGQTSCVPAVVAGELTGQVGGGVTLGEGACITIQAEVRVSIRTSNVLLHTFMVSQPVDWAQD